jgi:hypothetical protein
LTTRRLLGPTWRPLKALMAALACTGRGVGLVASGEAVRRRAEGRQAAGRGCCPGAARQEGSGGGRAVAGGGGRAALRAHLLARGVGKEGAAFGAPLRPQDGQLQDVAGRNEQGPQVLLNGLRGMRNRSHERDQLLRKAGQ